MSTAAVSPRSVAIVNDDERDRDVWSCQVAEAGYEPYIVRRPGNHSFSSVEEMANEVEQHASFAVIDHRLSPKGLAQFTGAETVAALYDRHRIAPLLVTTWEKQDSDTTIRLYRKKVPVLLSAQDFDDPETIRECFPGLCPGGLGWSGSFRIDGPGELLFRLRIAMPNPR